MFPRQRLDPSNNEGREKVTCRLAAKVVLLQRSTIAGVPIGRGIVSRRPLATSSTTEKDEQTYEEYSVPKINGIPIASNYETGVSGYNHPDPGMVMFPIDFRPRHLLTHHHL